MLQVEDTAVDKHVIEWSIKNISSSTVLEGERLECPVSLAGNLFGTAWVLFIYPRGKPGSDPNYLCCSLKREVDQVGPKKLSLEFEFSLVTFEGIKTFTKSGRKEFERGTCFDFHYFVKLEEIFSREELLHDDTLKFRCELRLLPRKKRTSLKTYVTEFPTKKILKSMYLENFQEISKQNPKVLNINEASEKELLLNVSMNRKGISEDRIIEVGNKDDELTESYLHMVMIKKKWDQPLHVSCCIKLLKKNLEVAIVKEIRHLFTEIMEKEELVLPHFIDINTLGEDCIDDGKLHLQFTFTICDSSQPVLLSIVEAAPMTLREEPKVNIPVYLYQTKRFSDVTLMVGDEEFQAHKSVLAARSPKFEEIFANLMKEGVNRKEGQKSIVEIGDIDKDTMEHMLKFIYTDQLKDLDNERILAIYTAAQKYMILPLQSKCIRVLWKNLTLQTVYEVLVVAEEYKDSELKSVVQEYILRHSKYVLLTPEWQAFAKEHKELSDEVVNYLRTNRR